MDALETLQARVAELEARLEIDREYRFDAATGRVVSVVPEDAAAMLDGIEARNETIGLLEDEAAGLRRRNRQLEATVGDLIARWDRLPAGKHRVETIQSWISDDLLPAFERARRETHGDMIELG